MTMEKRRAIVWFRQDLRIHDNEALLDALRHAQEVLPVYVFDERVFKGETRWYHFPKTNRFRARFIIESVIDLRKTLRRLGSDLIVRVGKPEEILFDLADRVKSSWIFCNRERMQEELDVQDALEQNLWSIGQEMRYSRGKMLYYTADLPFPITHTPDTFAQFRKEVERYVPVREPLPAPDNLGPLTIAVEAGTIPTVADFGLADPAPDERGVWPFRGGESEGLRRLQHFLWETDHIQDYHDARHGLIGEAFSTKFSPWLAQGCLSPKMVYHELKRYEAARGASDSVHDVVLQLLWRDYYRLMGKKHGSLIFFKGGMQGIPDPSLRDDWSLLQQWIDGRTGVPFIDANMREIRYTGYMSNRGRQNTASFLINELGVNWQMGAEYFESMLIDYDVTSNWGNWQAMGGVGPDAREGRTTNVVSQAQRFDPDGDYVRRWMPELADLVP